ncbi:MAG: biopolymer transporter ExbD [Acidobacteriota bacterium]
MASLKSSGVTDEIPTSSMADIAFLLIIFFMVTVTFTATRGLDFALPQDEPEPPVIDPIESVLIEIQPTGALLVDGSPRRLDQVVEYLRPKLQANPMKPVIINPDGAAPYGAMVDVYDELRGAAERGVEIKVISIPTQREIDAFWDLR